MTSPPPEQRFKCRLCEAESTWAPGYVHVARPGYICVTCELYRRRFARFYFVLGVSLLGLGWIAYRVTGSPMSTPVFVAGFLLLAYLSVVLHELGHALATKLAGVQVAVMSFGAGNRVKVVKRGGTFIIFGLLPTEGYIVPSHLSPDHYRKRQALVLVSGAVANSLGLLLGIGTMAVVSSNAAGLAALLWIGFNITGMLNLLPFTSRGPFGERHSDGKQLWRLIRLDDEKIRQIVAARKYLLAFLEYRFGSPQRALELVSDELGTARASIQISILGTAALVRAGRSQEAVRLARTCLDSDSLGAAERAMLQNNLAWALLEAPGETDLEEIDELSAAAFAVLPMILAVRSTRGTALIYNGRPEAGAALLDDQRFRLESPESRATVKSMLAIALAQIGDLAGAKRALSDARGLDPTNRYVDQASRTLAATKHSTGGTRS